MSIGSRFSRLNKAWLLAATPFVFTAPSQAQTGDNDETLDEIVITGSRIPRAGFDTLQPAVVIDSQFIQDRGYTDIGTALNELPIFGTPDNSTQGTQSSQSIGQTFVNLYGLGSQRTLTLVNGNRFVSGNSPALGGGLNPGTQVDLNMIPAVIVDRIETISIGGAPIYGADAIAGTVNVITKTDFEGFDIRLNYGISEQEEMEETVFSVAWGANSADGRGNVTVAFEHSDRAGMIESDMPHLAEGWQFRETDNPNFDLDLIAPGYANIVSSGGAITPGGRFGLIPNAGVGAWGPGGGQGYFTFAPDGSLVEYNTGTPIEGNLVWSVGGEGLFLPDVTALFSPLKRNLMTTFANYELSAAVEVYGELWAGQSQAAELVNQPRYSSGFFPDEAAALEFTVDNPFLTDTARAQLANLTNPDGTPLSSFWIQRASTDLLPNGRRGDSRTNLLRGVLGFRGDFAVGDRDFNWDINYNRGRNDTTTLNTDVQNDRFFYAIDAVDTPDGIQCRVVADPDSRPDDPASDFGTQQPTAVFDDCRPLNLFGAGAPSAEAIDYIAVRDQANTIIDQEVFQATLGTTNLVNLPAGGLGVAAGILRREEFADFRVSAFAQNGLGGADPVFPVAGGYTSDEIYAEVYAPIVSEDMDIPFVSYLNAEAAYRYIDNDVAGTDDAWTFGFKYAPIPDIELRYNVTRSVRAPAVTELFLPISGTGSFAADPCDGALLENGPNPAGRQANCASGGGGLPPITQPFVSRVRNASVQGSTGGNPNLVNEYSDSWTAGFVVRPRFAEGLQFSIDYLDFDIQDAIENFSLTQVMEACYDAADFPNEFCNQFRRVTSGPELGQLPSRDAFQTGFVNAGQRTFKAWQSDILYTVDLWAGQFDLGANLLYIAEDNETLLGTTDENAGEARRPDWRAQFNLRYSRDKWSALLQPRFIAGGRFSNQESPTLRSINSTSDEWLVNGSFRYDFTDNIGAQFNINNMFDSLPAPAYIATGVDDIYDNVGRFYRFSLSVRL